MPTDTPKKNPGPERRKLETKAFWIAFEMIFIFGVPAVLAVLGSRWLISEEVVDEWALYAALGLAFVLSWVIVFYRVRKLSAEFKQIGTQKNEGDKDNS